MNSETKQFINENLLTDVHELALKSGKYPLVDMQLAIRQINGKQKIRTKVPSFYSCEDLLYPAQLSLEQSSSESTAKYKSTLCEGNILVDLTGGFGVDFYFMSQNFRQSVYIEKQTELCELAENNFKALNIENSEIINANTENYLEKITDVDWIYLDPARRSTAGKKVFLISDCEPNVVDLFDSLIKKANRIMIKLSPMLDISAAVKSLPNTSEIHIIAVENECKEIVLQVDRLKHEFQTIKTINIEKNNKHETFDFQSDEEMNVDISYTHVVENYLYEPNAAIMKSGAFKLVSNRFKLLKLHRNTHLYTSNELLQNFPGRIFDVVKVWGSSKKELKQINSNISKANITTRNYPISVNELRKKINLKEGGEIYLFACTNSTGSNIIIECKKCNL